MRVTIRDSPQIIQKPRGCVDSGIPPTFIPKALVIILGIVSTIVIIAKNFMAMFRLLEITVANFTVASTPRVWNRQTNQYEDGQALFMRC